MPFRESFLGAVLHCSDGMDRALVMHQRHGIKREATGGITNCRIWNEIPILKEETKFSNKTNLTFLRMFLSNNKL